MKGKLRLLVATFGMLAVLGATALPAFADATVYQYYGGLSSVDDPCTPQIESINTFGLVTIVTSTGVGVYQTTQKSVDSISGQSATLIEKYVTPSSTGETEIRDIMQYQGTVWTISGTLTNYTSTCVGKAS